MPRPYSMDRRSAQAARTRDRVVTAAAELFAERGARATTMTEVARAADVSPATVFNHFATHDLLIEAVVTRLMAEVRIPDATIFTGKRSTKARLRALTEQMFEFYDRTGHWHRVLGPELADVPAVARADAEFRDRVHRLHAEAAGDDAALAKAITGLVHPLTLTALKQAGMSLAEATALVADSLAHHARR
ncbi:MULTISPECIES: TetR/AcrR family transcriptional regulator [unclassified Saccharothrix]|uniref:TetR/AcrR family transcriptional regulator n=1 Tax=unclassified Saccharothrix TaxID=2593673 RepID=UPI00307F16BF